MSHDASRIDALVLTRREEIVALARRHGARKVRLFGSMARGEATAASDVDLLVEAGPDRTPFFPGGLVADLEDLLGRKVQVVTERALRPSLRAYVLAEAVEL